MTVRLAHLPLPATYGQRPDGTTWLSFGRFSEGTHIQFDGPPCAEAAADICRAINAFGPASAALEAVRSDFRDPDTDTALAPATGELVEAALAATEGRS